MYSILRALQIQVYTRISIQSGFEINKIVFSVPSKTIFFYHYYTRCDVAFIFRTEFIIIYECVILFADSSVAHVKNHTLHFPYSQQGERPLMTSIDIFNHPYPFTFPYFLCLWYGVSCFSRPPIQPHCVDVINERSPNICIFVICVLFQKQYCRQINHRNSTAIHLYSWLKTLPPAISSSVIFQRFQ